LQGQGNDTEIESIRGAEHWFCKSISMKGNR
jgi:hypothetical protein